MEEENTTEEETPEESEEGVEETPEEETPEEPEGEEPEEEDLPEEPQTRKSADYWRSETEKLKTKKARAEYFKTKKSLEGGDISAALDEKLEPLKKAFQTQADEKELQDTLVKYPDAKKFEDKIRKYSQAYSNVPIDLITRGFLYGRNQKKAEADEEARGSRLGGHSKRPIEGKMPDFSKMTDAEILDYERKVLQEQRG